MSLNRPNRSDVHLTVAEESKIEEETREYFDDLAPKRHTKPQRSDYSSQYTDAQHGNVIPEFVKFQDLEHDDAQKLEYGGSEAPEEYVETEYYKDLNCVGKQHHTTGTGFIRVENTNSSCFKLAPDSTGDFHASKGNPATNDWIPAADDDMTTVSSDKPKRSEN